MAPFLFLFVFVSGFFFSKMRKESFEVLIANARIARYVYGKKNWRNKKEQKVEEKQGFSLIQTRFRRKLSKKDSREFTSGAKLRFFFTARTLELASSIFILNVFSLQTQKGSSNCYQYQLQNMWQKCWNQNAAMLQGIRYFSFYILNLNSYVKWHCGLQKMQVSRARPNEIVASWDDGGGNLVS